MAGTVSIFFLLLTLAFYLTLPDLKNFQVTKKRGQRPFNIFDPRGEVFP
jgi:hypothetical protein